MNKENEFEFVLKLAIDKNNLDALIHLILGNSELNYMKDDLRITNETTIMQFIKYLHPSAYKEKLEELQREENNKCQE